MSQVLARDLWRGRFGETLAEVAGLSHSLFSERFTAAFKTVAGFESVDYISGVTREIPGLRMSWAPNLFGIHRIVSGSSLMSRTLR